MAKAKKKKPALLSMERKSPGKNYRTGEKNGKRVTSALDRLALKTKRKKKAKKKQ